MNRVRLYNLSYSKWKKRIVHGQVKKYLFYWQIVLSFRRDFAPVIGQFFVPLWYFECAGFQLFNPVGYRYLYTGKWERN